MYDICLQDNHPDVAESAVVGFPHDIKGEGGQRALWDTSSRKVANYLLFLGIYAYVTLKEHATITPEDLRSELKELVKKEIGSFASPEIIQVYLGIRIAVAVTRIKFGVRRDRATEAH